MSEIARCTECTDELVQEAIPCTKCGGSLCGYCCEFEGTDNQ